MDLPKRRGQFEPVRITGDNLVNGIGAELFVVEFFCWASCSDVLRAKPHSVTDAVSWGFMPVNIVNRAMSSAALTNAARALLVAQAILDVKLSKDSSRDSQMGSNPSRGF